MVDRSVVQECFGCDSIRVDKTCDVWASPAAKWSLGQCPTSTTFVKEVAAPKKKTNPLKASKKARRG